MVVAIGLCLILTSLYGQNIENKNAKLFSRYTDSLMLHQQYDIYNLEKNTSIKPLKPEIDYNRLITNYNFKTNMKRTTDALKIPCALAFIGLYSGHENNTNSWIGKRTIQDKIRTTYPDFRSHWDDYIQWGPIAATYSLKAFGIKGKNDMWTSTKLLLKAEIATGLLCHTFKNLACNTRPNGRNTKSFPSGHTSQAFVAATFMHKELGDVSPWYSVAGYGMATTVGAMRMMNNMHWFSDVMVGAAAGIGVTNIIYLLHDKRKERKERRWVAMPTMDSRTIGLAMHVQL